MCSRSLRSTPSPRHDKPQLDIERSRIVGSFSLRIEEKNAPHMEELRTQVAIVGAGPAGLMLGRLLHLIGIDSIIIENRSEDYVMERVRAGVLEQGAVDLMIESGVGARLQREGLFHDGIYINVFGTRHRIDMAALTGRRITVYGQNEVVKDLIADRRRTGRPHRLGRAGAERAPRRVEQPVAARGRPVHERPTDGRPGVDPRHTLAPADGAGRRAVVAHQGMLLLNDGSRQHAQLEQHRIRKPGRRVVDR